VAGRDFLGSIIRTWFRVHGGFHHVDLVLQVDNWNLAMTRLRDQIYAAWDRYDQTIPRSVRSDDAAIFDADQIIGGVLVLPADAAAIVAAAPRLEFSSGLTSSAHVTIQFDETIESQIRACTHFRVVVGPLRLLMKSCVNQLRQPVARALGSPWRVLNVRAWTTPAAATAYGMYAFHHDGFPVAIFKIMIYFTPMDQEHGTLEIDRDGEIMALSGPAASWVLFYNSTIIHRGIPGTAFERASAEITLSRAKNFDLTLRQPGLNAHYPVQP
jgi:hypothetical protein